MIKIRLVLFALLAVVSLHSFAADIKSELKEVILANQNSVIESNLKTFLATSAPDINIVDEFPPFLWNGKDAAARYFKDFQDLLTKFKVSDYKLDLKDPTFIEQDKDVAYAVFPVTVSYKVGNVKAHTDTGYQAVVFKKATSGKWLIESSTWAVSNKTIK
jgi:ketosteroid isomerase-like protein